jgi:hypothetical protein
MDPKEYQIKIEFNKRWSAMKAEAYQGWMSSWSDLSTYINQKRGWFDTRPNRGFMIDHKVLLDNYATQANKTLASGLLSGMTSPSRPWFRLTIDDVTLDQDPAVRPWLDEVQKRMVQVFNQSNIYSAFYNAYEELGQFGTSCFIILEDFDSVIRCRSFTAGEYYLSVDARGRINGYARYFWMTAGAMAKEFGLEQCSAQVKMLLANNQPDTWVKIAHLIEENQTRIMGQETFENKKYRSAYWEYGSAGVPPTNGMLAQRGFDRFPVIATRWETATTDQIYGFGPGWYALGNVKQLQRTVLDKLIAQEKIHNPPMIQDASVEGHSNVLPGGVTKVTGSNPNGGVRPAYQINPDLNSFIELINSLRQSIDKDFFVNLFMMLLNVDNNAMTATEVAERQQEKIMMMGPVLYKLQEELLDPTMELVYGIMLDNNLLPPPPESIAGMDIRVKYVSILAQAQEALGVEQINRVIGFVTSVGQAYPEALDVVDIGETVREIANLEGIPAKLIRNKAAVQSLQEQRQEQMQQAQQMQAANVAADTAQKGTGAAKNLADAKNQDGSSALEQLVSQMKGKR